ncbi:MAG: hypothetical protein Q7J84_15285 [Sulfuricaulis sp.]|nr:hypothetical protein [Sulfuricaulis sp.]
MKYVTHRKGAKGAKKIILSDESALFYPVLLCVFAVKFNSYA